MRHREFNIILRFWESGAAEASGRMAAEEAQEELSEEISRCARGAALPIRDDPDKRLPTVGAGPATIRRRAPQ